MGPDKSLLCVIVRCIAGPLEPLFLALPPMPVGSPPLTVTIPKALHTFQTTPPGQTTGVCVGGVD